MVARSSGEIARAIASQLQDEVGTGLPTGASIWTAALRIRMHASLGASDHDNSFQRGLLANREHFLQLHFAGNKNNARPRIAQNIGSLFGGERSINRDGHRAQQQGSEVRNHPLRPVLAQNGNPLALGRCPNFASPPATAATRGEKSPKKPAPILLPAAQHHPRMPTFDHSKKNIVKCAQTHSKRGDEIMKGMYWFARPLATRSV